MRSRSFAAALFALALAPACATRTQPYRFASPMLGVADVPRAAAPLGTQAPISAPATRHISSRRAAPIRVAGGWQADTQQGPIRTVSAAGIDARMPTASAEAATAVTNDPYARPIVWSRLPAPHRTASSPVQSDGITAPLGVLGLREPSDLRVRVGQRDKRDPYAIVIAWLADLGLHVDGSATEGSSLVAWAERTGRLAAPTDTARPGDLLVFDHAVGGAASDLVAIVIGRDARGVSEYMYAGGGVVRRGFLDPTRPSIRRDLEGAVVNTFLRHGKQWPPKGTRYLAGELLTHVVRTR